VKEVFAQRYYNYANYFTVYDGLRTSLTYFENSNDYYSAITFPMHNVQTDFLRFYFTWHNSYYRFSRVEVYGCYNTSTPTTVPTSAPTELPTVLPTISPSELPTVLPTISPTLPPVTTYPTKTPSVFPTTAPTESPSADNPSTYPSISPTWSPTTPPSGTEPPSPLPSSSPSSSPTVIYIDRGFHISVGQIEFLIIVIVALCGVIFFLFRRYKKVSQVANNFGNVHESEMQIVQSRDIEEAGTEIVSKSGFNRKTVIDKTLHNEGEGEEKKERSLVMPQQTADFRFGLDKVVSDL